MLNVVCVCKSGGNYDAEWVRKLVYGVRRHTEAHIYCLSDIEVPCERVELQHGWPGWWSKIELFRPGVIEGPTLYLDLDTVVVGDVSVFREVPTDFAMLRNFWEPEMVGSGVMWFGDNVPHGVYTKFARQADAYMKHHERVADGPYLGDQAFIWDTLNREVEQVNDYVPGIYSYKRHCAKGLPKDALLVCFHGEPKLNNVKADWLEEHWK